MEVEYGPNDVATIVATYKRDQARFDRYYSGRNFLGTMLFHSAQSSLVGGYYISLSSGSVLCEYVRASDIDAARVKT